jgi:hypothetical protein
MIEMKKYLSILTAVFLMTVFDSCNSYELFEREQYKNVFALLSYEDNNIFLEEHDLTNPQTEGFISAVCGGSRATDRDISISIVEDPDILLDYNITNYDTRTEEYDRLLPASHYTVEDYSIRIPAGERNGLMKINIRPEGLSPDSVYFIPFRVSRFSSYEVNPDKSYVMYRVLLKNYYAKMNSVKQGTSYTLRGNIDGVSLTTTKQLMPVTGNSVRMTAGNISGTGSVNFINNSAIVLQIDENNRVHISPWKNLEVTQIDDDPDYPNIFMIEKTEYNTYKTFLLRYDYVYDGESHSIQEELRFSIDDNENIYFVL